MNASAQLARYAISLIFLVNGTLFATWAVNIPVVRDRLHLSAAEVGVALLALGLGSLVTMPLTGGWTARFGSARVVAVSVVLSMLSLAWPFLMPNLVTLSAALALMGGLNGALDVAMNAQGVTVEKALGKPIMSRLHAFYSLGGLLGSLLGAALLGRVPALWHVLAVVVAGTLIGGQASRYLLPEAPGPEAGAQKAGEGATAQPPTPGPAGGLALLLGVPCALGMLSEGANYDWAALYFRDILGVVGGAAGLGYAAFVGAMTLGRWLGDGWRARLGDQQTVRLGAWVCAAGLALVLCWPHPLAAGLGFALSGLGLSNCVPVLYGAAGHALHGKGIAQVATIGYGGFLLGPPIIGFAAEHWGLRAALGLALLGALLVGVLARPVFTALRRAGTP